MDEYDSRDVLCVNIWTIIGPPSFFLLGRFLGTGSFFSHGVRGPCELMHDRAEFFGKNPLLAKMTKTGQK